MSNRAEFPKAWRSKTPIGHRTLSWWVQWSASPADVKGAQVSEMPDGDTARRCAASGDLFSACQAVVRHKRPGGVRGGPYVSIPLAVFQQVKNALAAAKRPVR